MAGDAIRLLSEAAEAATPATRHFWLHTCYLLGETGDVLFSQDAANPEGEVQQGSSLIVTVFSGHRRGNEQRLDNSSTLTPAKAECRRPPIP